METDKIDGLGSRIYCKIEIGRKRSVSTARVFDERQDRSGTALHGRIISIVSGSELLSLESLIIETNSLPLAVLIKTINSGRINGWVGTNSIFGKLVKFED